MTLILTAKTRSDADLLMKAKKQKKKNNTEIFRKQNKYLKSNSSVYFSPEYNMQIIRRPASFTPRKDRPIGRRDQRSGNKFHLIRSGESSLSFLRNLLMVSSMVLPILSPISPSFSLKGKPLLLFSQSSSHLLFDSESTRSPAEDETRFNSRGRGLFAKGENTYLCTKTGRNTSTHMQFFHDSGRGTGA